MVDRTDIEEELWSSLGVGMGHVLKDGDAIFSLADRRDNPGEILWFVLCTCGWHGSRPDLGVWEGESCSYCVDLFRATNEESDYWTLRVGPQGTWVILDPAKREVLVCNLENSPYEETNEDFQHAVGLGFIGAWQTAGGQRPGFVEKQIFFNSLRHTLRDRSFDFECQCAAPAC